MQLLLDGQQPVLVTLTNAQRGTDRVVEFHTPNDTGTTTVTIAVHVGAQLRDGDYRAIGQAVMAVLS